MKTAQAPRAETSNAQKRVEYLIPRSFRVGGRYGTYGLGRFNGSAYGWIGNDGFSGDTPPEAAIKYGPKKDSKMLTLAEVLLISDNLQYENRPGDLVERMSWDLEKNLFLDAKPIVTRTLVALISELPLAESLQKERIKSERCFFLVDNSYYCDSDHKEKRNDWRCQIPTKLALKYSGKTDLLFVVENGDIETVREGKNSFTTFIGAENDMRVGIIPKDSLWNKTAKFSHLLGRGVRGDHTSIEIPDGKGVVKVGLAGFGNGRGACYSEARSEDYVLTPMNPRMNGGVLVYAVNRKEAEAVRMAINKVERFAAQNVPANEWAGETVDNYTQKFPRSVRDTLRERMGIRAVIEKNIMDAARAAGIDTAGYIKRGGGAAAGVDMLQMIAIEKSWGEAQKVRKKCLPKTQELANKRFDKISSYIEILRRGGDGFEQIDGLIRDAMDREGIDRAVIRKNMPRCSPDMQYVLQEMLDEEKGRLGRF
ncbi:Uncharacterised protein [Candidatus Gugararchaeum adminiculabundum]|nr:Uncharacterised protein [Candidatus Gugararchaeum adminiculabundum]